MNILIIAILSIVFWSKNDIYKYDLNFIEYHVLSSKAMCEIHQSNYKEALIIYRELLHKYSILFADEAHNDYLNIAIAYSNLNKGDSCAHYLKLAILNGLKKQSLTKADLIESDKNHSLLVYDSLNTIFLRNLDTSYLMVIEEIIEIDQKYREEFMSKRSKQFNIIDSFLTAGLREQQILDSLNCLKFLELVKENGWPTYRKIGNSNINVIIHHLPYSLREEFDKLLYKNLLDGKIHPNIYASFIDKVEYLNSGKQIYGTILIQVSSIGEFGFVPFLHDINEVNEKRSEIGLSSIECIASILNIIIMDY